MLAGIERRSSNKGAGLAAGPFSYADTGGWLGLVTANFARIIAPSISAGNTPPKKTLGAWNQSVLTQPTKAV